MLDSSIRPGPKGTRALVLPARETNGEIIVRAEKRHRPTDRDGRTRSAGWSAQLNAAIFLLIPRTILSPIPADAARTFHPLLSPSHPISRRRDSADDNSNAPRLFRQATVTICLVDI